MLKQLFVSAMVLGSINAFAEWKEDAVIFQAKDASHQKEIATALSYSKVFKDHLSTEDLASSTKLIINRLSVSVVQYKWENDDTCKVLFPKKVKPVIVESGDVNYHFMGNIFDKHSEAIAQSLPISPCRVGMNTQESD